MIESCTKRRMIISVVGLGILTLLILVLEEALTSGPVNQTPTPYSANQSTEKVPTQAKLKSATPQQLLSNISFDKSCWLVESYEVIEGCAPCTGFEINSQTPIACIETGLKEKIKCKTAGLAYRSCSSVKEIEERNFFIFLFSMLLIFVLSYGVAKLRTSQLERKTIKNIEKRLASGQ